MSTVTGQVGRKLRRESIIKDENPKIKDLRKKSYIKIYGKENKITI